jgi:hypothetical protein
MNEEGGQQTVHMIMENGGEATFVQVDVSQATAVEAMISKTVETYGQEWSYPTKASTVGKVSCGSDRSCSTRLDAICTSNRAGFLPCRPFLSGRHKNSAGYASICVNANSVVLQTSQDR